MTLPADWNLVTVSHTYLTLEGLPAEGSVTFKSAEIVTVDGVTVVPRRLTVQLDENGSFSIDLPSTNDPDLDLTGWSYLVIEHIKGGRPPYAVVVPFDAGAVDLLALAPPAAPAGDLERWRLKNLIDVDSALDSAPNGSFLQKVSGVWTFVAGGGGGVTDHGALNGLADDDHSQYALTDGSRGDFATVAQGAKADTATQPAALAAAISTHAGATDPHGDRAYADGLASNYATAAQGTLADSAVQPGDLAAVATSNSYDDLDDLPTLGSAAATDSGDYATAAQGALADTAVQPAALSSYQLTSEKGAADGYASLDSGGQIPAAQIPAVAITTYLGEAADQTAMLALSGQYGDWTVRTDTGTVWIITGADPSVIGGWTELTYPAAPVSSVAGRTGTVTLTSSDLTDTTSAGRALLDDADSAAQRTTLGLGSAATSDTGDFAAASHTHPLSELQQSSATSGQVPTWNGSAWVPATPSAGSPGGSSGQIQYNNAGAFGGAPLLWVDANTMHQRNGASAQSFFLSNSYTDGANYELAFIRWVSNRIQFGYEAAGSGSNNRGLDIFAGSSGSLRIGNTVKFFEFSNSGSGTLKIPQVLEGKTGDILVRGYQRTGGTADGSHARVQGSNAVTSGVGGDAYVFGGDGVSGDGGSVYLDGGAGSAAGEVRVGETRGRLRVYGDALFAKPPQIPAYTVATVPSASAYNKGAIIVTDESGGEVLAVSDGTNWRRSTDRAVVS